MKTPADGRDILLCTLGTRGDLYPFLAMAESLRDLGYRPTIATHIEYADLCGQLQIPFLRLYPDFARLEGEWDRIADKNSIKFIMEQLLLPSLEINYAAITAVDFDFLINHPLVLAGPIAAEKLNKKWASVALSPFGLFSAHDPPVIPHVPFLSNPSRGRAWLYGPILRLADAYFRKLSQPIQTFRLKLGLSKSKRNPLTYGQFSPHTTLALFSSLWSSAQPDWPPQTKLLGFSLWQNPSADQNVARLSDEKIVLVGLGSAWSILTKPEILLLIQDLRKFSDKVVIVAGTQYPEFQLLLAGERQFEIVREVNYAKILYQAKVFINSGGIGAVAEGLRHGSIQIVLPFASDQFDNARRVSKLGFGIEADRKKLGRHDWPSALRRLEQAGIANLGQAASEIRAETLKFTEHLGKAIQELQQT
jgi:rhamnosyltransferase subunit B